MLVLSSPQRNLSGTGINLPKIMQPVSVGADRSAACLGALSVTPLYIRDAHSHSLCSHACLGAGKRKIRHLLSPFIPRNTAMFFCSKCPLIPWRNVTIYCYHFHSPHPWSLESTLDIAARVTFLKCKSYHVIPLLKSFSCCLRISKSKLHWGYDTWQDLAPARISRFILRHQGWTKPQKL